MEVNDGQDTVEFDYDGDGNLLRETVNGASSRFIYDLSGLLPELAAQKDQGGQLIRFPYGWERLGELGTTRGNRFYLTDGTDTVVGLLDDLGELIASYSFDPFGAPLESVSPTASAPSLRPSLGLASIGQGLVSAGKVPESAQITPPPSPPIVFPAMRRVYGTHYNPALRLLVRPYSPPYNPALHLLVRYYSPTYNPALHLLVNSYAQSVKFVVDPQTGQAIQYLRRFAEILIPVALDTAYHYKIKPWLSPAAVTVNPGFLKWAKFTGRLGPGVVASIGVVETSFALSDRNYGMALVHSAAAGATIWAMLSLPDAIVATFTVPHGAAIAYA